MKSSRILYLTSTASGYGGENALLDALRSLPDEFEPIVTAPEDGPLLGALTSSGIQSRVVPFAVLHRPYFHPLRIFLYIGFALASFFRLLSLFKSLRPQIIHTNNLLVLPGAFAAKTLHIPHVWHVREIIEGHHIHPFLWRIWRWIILALSTKVVCISTAVRQQFADHPKTVVISDGVDTNFFSPTASSVSQASPTQKALVVGMVARLEHRRKGQDLFIDAAHIALQKRKDLHFIIVGHERKEFAERELALYEMVEHYRLADKIEFRGYVPRETIVDIIKELDVLVLCSRQPEGLGLVLLEAMSCGKPVIAPAEGGPLDIVEDHRSGLLIPARDPQKLADAILYLAEHPEERRKMGDAGRKRVESSFQAEQAAIKTAALYREILHIA
jgi:glycosyltransferase involved in cell wall biosynthesis